MMNKPTTQVGPLKPTRYELLIEHERIILRGYAATALGYFTVESVPLHTGASLRGLRKHGKAQAARFGVPFIDKTSAD